MNGAFTTREREIIRLICERNLCDKELAQTLGIEYGTVVLHKGNIYRKLRDRLGCQEINRIDLALYGLLAGYADTGKLRVKYAIPDERMAAAAPL